MKSKTKNFIPNEYIIFRFFHPTPSLFEENLMSEMVNSAFENWHPQKMDSENENLADIFISNQHPDFDFFQVFLKSRPDLQVISFSDSF